MRLRDRFRKWLGFAEKAEGKYSLLERVPQLWKFAKRSSAWFAAAAGAGATVFNRLPTVTMPGFPPWLWEVLALSVFFSSTFVLLYRQTRQNRKLESLLSQATTIGEDKHGYMSVVPLIQQTEVKPTTPSTEQSLSDNEKEAIERIRVLWRSEAHDASWSAIKLFTQVKDAEERLTSLAELLERPLDDLLASRKAMDMRVSNKSTATLDEVCQCFGEFFQNYKNVFQWFHKVEEDGIVVTEAPYTEAHGQWKERHNRFRDELLRIANRADSIELRRGLEQYGTWVPQND